MKVIKKEFNLFHSNRRRSLNEDDLILNSDELILITGSNGFIGSRVVAALINYGFKNLRCFVRPSSDLTELNNIISAFRETNIEVVQGNLLSHDDCNEATKGVSVIYHLAAGVGKSFAGCVMDSVVTTRNLLESTLHNTNLKRFLNVSSIAVYSGAKINRGGLLDETSLIETIPHKRCEAYVYGKIKQDELLLDYHKKNKIPYVIVRPGDVYGPGKRKLSGKVGLGTFGLYLHLGGSNRIPLLYIDNCADAIVLAGIKKGIDGEVFNIVDDDLPTSREFLRMYKKNVGHFKSIYIPYGIFYFLCYLWEKYSKWSRGQLPPHFNRLKCAAEWKNIRYSNQKIKKMLGWDPIIPFDEASKRYFEYMKNGDSKC